MIPVETPAPKRPFSDQVVMKQVNINEFKLHERKLILSLILKILDKMKPAYWRIIDANSISMSFLLCFSGFLAMNTELLFDNLAQSPSPSNCYLGLTLFLLGMISHVLTLRSA